MHSNDPRDTLIEILAEYTIKTKAHLESRDINFSHYTSSIAAIGIMKNKTMWMRNSALMNDYSEIRYGENFLMNCWNDRRLGNALKKTLDYIDTQIHVNITNRLTEHIKHREHQTFILSISEHDPNENIHGRLSMWRAYGGNAGVAIILNRELILAMDGYNIILMPVQYVTQRQFRRNFQNLIYKIRDKIKIIREIDINSIENALYNYLHYTIMSTKHPGFSEEREWRMLYCPTLNTSHGAKHILEVIKEIPQVVYGLDLDFFLSKIPNKPNLNHLIERIIIGPTQNPNIIGEALSIEVEKFCPKNPFEKLIRSEIPLRR